MNETEIEIEIDKKNAISLAIEKFKDRFFNSIISSTKSNPFILGMGSGTTAALLFKMLFEEIERLSGKDIFVLVVPTSYQSLSFVSKKTTRIFPTCISNVDYIDCLIDGADRILPDQKKIIIKGGGGAHTLEKLVQKLSKFTIYVIEEKKLSLKDYCVPVEALSLSIGYIIKRINNDYQGVLEPLVRQAKHGKLGPIITENGHFILDLKVKKDVDMERLAIYLDSITGVIEHGIFIDSSDLIIVGNRENGYILA